MSIVKNSILKKYHWQKSWVRPYESVFGIFLNFCRVNVLEGYEALRIFNIAKIQYTNYIPEFMMYCASKYGQNYQNILEILTPKWYLSQIKIFQKMDVYTCDNCLYTDQVIYCPECLKSGYHSILHQIRGIKYCPFHPNKLLIQSPRKYWFNYLITSITWMDANDVFSIKKVVLPCFRREIKTLLEFKLRTNAQFWYVSTDNEWQDRSYACNTLDVLSKCNSDRKIQVEKELISFQQFKEIFIQWYNQLQLPMVLWKRGFTNKLEIKDVGSNCVNFFLYAKFISLFSEDEIKITAREICKIAEMKHIKINQIVALKIYFIWLIKDSPNIYCALNIDWLFHPWGYDNSLRYFVGNRALVIDNIGYVFNEHRIGDSNVDNNILFFYIVSDIIDVLWEQVCNLARLPDGFDTMNGWKKLKVPEYFITYIEEEEIYEIHRYNG